MDLLKVFEKTNLVVPIEQKDFFSFFEDTIIELTSSYGEKFVFSDESYAFMPPENLEAQIPVLPLYVKAITENIIFLAGAGDNHKGEFIRLAKDAYISYWKDDAKGRKVKRNRW